ncbi:MAG: DUF4058 family protein [Planctomycetes bacterium]|nr:DUF4058 family protein [Planctomycetota bacterium]
MASPFPGMDPYLESPQLWPDVHHGLISEMQAALNPALRPRYVARVELRVYISDDDDPGREVIIPDVRITKTKRKSERKPKKAKTDSALALVEPLTVPLLLDDEIEEARLEIRQHQSGSLVTVIEVLSPTNKIRGSRGRASFMEKRREILASAVHWVEIDLLRAGQPSVTHPPLVPSDYRLLISRAGEHGQARYWPFSIRQVLPEIDIPLRGKGEHVPLDLAALLNAVYVRGAYDLSIDYRKEPEPPLRPTDAAWADRLLRSKELR